MKGRTKKIEKRHNRHLFRDRISDCRLSGVLLKQRPKKYKFEITAAFRVISHYVLASVFESLLCPLYKQGHAVLEEDE